MIKTAILINFINFTHLLNVPMSILNNFLHVMENMEDSDLMPQTTDTCSNECLDINSEGSHSSKRKSTNSDRPARTPAKKHKNRGDEVGDKATLTFLTTLKKIARQYLNSQTNWRMKNLKSHPCYSPYTLKDS